MYQCSRAIQNGLTDLFGMLTIHIKVNNTALSGTPFECFCTFQMKKIRRLNDTTACDA